MINELRAFDILRMLGEKGYSIEDIALWYLEIDNFANFSFNVNNLTKIITPVIISLFRERFNILIEITVKNSKYGFIISKIPSGEKICDDMDVYPVKYFTNWYESALMAIKYCITEVINFN